MERKSARPSFTEEKELAAQGYRLIAGVDEVGRGALAGPVAAAAVILPPRLRGKWLQQVRDSKQLTATRREYLSEHIREKAVSFGIGYAECAVVDKVGIVRATHRAMQLAIEQLSPPADFLLIDYLRLPGVQQPQKGITRGDSISLSIACASIIAKVSRDQLMVELDREHAGYGLAGHKGYGTRSHLESLRRLGPSPVHRRSFRPICQLRLPLPETG